MQSKKSILLFLMPICLSQRHVAVEIAPLRPPQGGTVPWNSPRWGVRGAKVSCHMFLTNTFLMPIALILILLLAACRGQGENDAPPPDAGPKQEAAPARENDPAPAPAAAQQTENKPSEAGATPPQATTVYQAAQLLDLRDLPLPDGASPAAQVAVGQLIYQAATSVAEVVDQYSPLLTDQGWQERSDQAYVDDTTATLYFSQKGYTVSLSASALGERLTSVTLLNHGNIDLVTLPQTADAEPGFAAPNTLIYFSPTSVTDVSSFTRRALAAQGWHEYTRPTAAPAARADPP